MPASGQPQRKVDLAADALGNSTQSDQGSKPPNSAGMVGIGGISLEITRASQRFHHRSRRRVTRPASMPLSSNRIEQI